MKMIVLGLDGFSPSYLEKWKDNLPNLSNIIQNGAYGELESTIPPETLPAWISMFTGKKFSNIEAFGLIDLDKTYKKVPVDPMKWKNEYVWDILSSSNIKVGIFYLPFLHHSYRVNGFMITDPVLGNDMYPENVITNITPEFDPQEEKEIRWRIFYQKPALFKELVEKTQYDFYFFLISISDVMIHLGDEKELLKAYKEIDQNIVPLIKKMCEKYKYYLFIVSDHGSKKTHKKFNINTFLKKKRYLKTDEIKFRGLIGNLVQKMMGILPVKIVRKLQNTYYRVFADKGTVLFPQIVYKKSIAFGGGAGNTSYCGVWLNKKDAFEEGIVTKDEEDKILTKLVNDLKEVEEIEEVFTRAELGYNKKIVFPDIVIRTKDDFATYFPVFPSVVHHSEEIVHSDYGIVVANGPCINHNPVNAKINDIAPTILHFFGLPIPEYMDGRVLIEIFERNSEFAKKILRYVDSDYYKKKLENKRVKRAIKSKKLKENL